MFVYLCCSFSCETDAYNLYAQFYVDLLLCYVYKMKQKSGELALFMLYQVAYILWSERVTVGGKKGCSLLFPEL
jgi:hypothetical protein